MFEEVVRYVVLGLLALIFAYVCARAVSIGYFRTRIEFFRTMKREREGGSEDGRS